MHGSFSWALWKVSSHGGVCMFPDGRRVTPRLKTSTRWSQAIWCLDLVSINTINSKTRSFLEENLSK